MASLEEYAIRAFAQNPAALDPIIDQDLADAHAKLGEHQAGLSEASAKIADLMEVKYQIHPEMRPQPVVEAPVEVAPEVAQG